MVRIDIKGIHKVKARGRTYRYAWRGGPRLRGEPGSLAFMADYNAAIEARRLPDPGRFRALVTLYKSSGDYQKLACAAHSRLRARRALTLSASYPTGQ